MKRTIREMSKLVAAAMIVLTGAAWADATYTSTSTSTSSSSSTSSSGTRTYTETTSTSLNRAESSSTYGSGQIYRPTPDDGEDTTLVSLPNFCTVMFDANGGVCSEMARNVERDTAVGSLPEATREGWTFLGWFTGKDSGGRIREYTVVKDSAVYYAHWKNDYSCDSCYDDGKWYTSRSEAIEAARATGKKIFLICGRDFCYDALTTKLACEDQSVKPQLTAKCVLWYSDVDTQESQNGKYLPSESFELPVVCVIDPDDADHYIKRATGGDYGGALSWSDVLAFIADIPYPPESDSSKTSSGRLQPNTASVTTQHTDAKTLYGAVYDGYDVVGIVSLKLGRVSAKKSTRRVSGVVTLLDGKRCVIKSQQAAVGGATPISLEVGKLGTMDITVDGDQFSGTLRSWRVQTASVGGNWRSSGVTVSVDAGDTSAIPGTVLDFLLPNAERGVSSGTRWTFAKTAGVKWAKPKAGVQPVVLDPESGKGLVIDTSRDKTNLSGIRLTYMSKSGTFEGSFKVYALEGLGKFTKLKKYTAKVAGVVVNGVGYGSATLKRPEIAWPLTVR